MPVSSNARLALYAQETDKAFPVLLTIAHPDIADWPLHFVNDGQNLVSRGNTYVAFPFTIDIPDQDPDRPVSVSLVIDNVDQRIIEGLRSISSAPTVTMEVVLSDTPDTVEAGPFQMTLRGTTYDQVAIQGQLSFEDILNEPYPGDSFTPANFPALF